MIKVISIGHASYDIYIQVDDFPKEGIRERYQKTSFWKGKNSVLERKREAPDRGASEEITKWPRSRPE